jgi:hypothetical protein
MDMAKQLEARAHEFFRLPSYLGVLAVDRATHGIGLAATYLGIHAGVKWGVIPTRTYRAARDALQQACVLPGFHNDEPEPDIFNIELEQPEVTVIVPTTLGGTAMWDSQFREDYRVIYDCAHTCHPDMFEGTTLGQNHFVVTSHFPTKPCGAFGGGLVIGMRGAIEWMRCRAWPTDFGKACAFCYPQTVQSWAIMHRLRTFDRGYWTNQTGQLEEIVDLLGRRLDIQPVWPTESPLTPHLLTYEHDEALDEACKRANLETGDHYPHVNPRTEYEPHLSLPFHSPEVLTRLKEVL